MTMPRLAALALCSAFALGLGTTRTNSIDTALFVDSGEGVRALEFDRTINAPPELVWTQLTTEAGVKRWMGVDSTVNLAIGGAYELYFNEGRGRGNKGTEGTQVLSYAPGRILSLSWNVPTNLGQVRGLRSWVTFLIEPSPQGSTVRVVHAGFGDTPGWDKAYDYYETGWPTVLGMLKRSLEGVAD
ncbi:MAG: SRPBCC domain-containing protein [Planctomycetota bacterium]